MCESVRFKSAPSTDVDLCALVLTRYRPRPKTRREHNLLSTKEERDLMDEEDRVRDNYWPYAILPDTSDRNLVLSCHTGIP